VKINETAILIPRKIAQRNAEFPHLSAKYSPSITAGVGHDRAKLTRQKETAIRGTPPALPRPQGELEQATHNR
jgi:hypothetical protein